MPGIQRYVSSSKPRGFRKLFLQCHGNLDRSVFYRPKERVRCWRVVNWRVKTPNFTKVPLNHDCQFPLEPGTMSAYVRG